MDKKKIFFVTTILLLIGGGSAYAYTWFMQQKKLLNDYCYDILNWRLTSLSLQNIQVSFDMSIRNPSDISIDVNGYNLKVSIDNTFVAQVFSATKFKISKKSTSIFTVYVDVPFSSVAQVFPLLFSGITNRMLNVEGVVNVQKYGFMIEKDIKISTRIGELMIGKSSKCVA